LAAGQLKDEQLKRLRVLDEENAMQQLAAARNVLDLAGLNPQLAGKRRPEDRAKLAALARPSDWQM